MTQSRSISVGQAIAVTMLITMTLNSMLISVEAQFVYHLINPGNQERTSQKLLQHIMELELPLAARHAPKRDSRATNMNGRELSSSSTGDAIVDNNKDENECDQYSSQFEYNCVCSRTSFGTIFCRRQQYPKKLARNDPVVSLTNDFEKLIDQLEARPAQMRKHHSASVRK